MNNIFYKKISLSTIDFPGELSTILFTKKCNMRCDYCYNLKELRTIKKAIPNEEIISFLENRYNFLTGIVISGGEALINENMTSLYKLAFEFKRLGYKIKIDTNGSFPTNLKLMIDHGLIDYVAMDVKNIGCFFNPFFNQKDNPFDIKFTSPQINTFKILIENNVPFELRSTMVYPFIKDNELIDIAKILIKETGIDKIDRWFLQEARLNKDIVLNPSTDMKAISISEIIDIQKKLKEFVHEVSIR